MLREVAAGVLVHESDFLQSNAVIVRGAHGVLVVDPGIREAEIVGIADGLRESGHAVVAGFSTHPHWDHLLWHSALGSAPRYGTARGAAIIQSRLLDPEWRTAVGGMLPEAIADQIPLNEEFGRMTGLAAGTVRMPWDGPDIRIIEHDGHAPGHAALLIEEPGVLVAGDMLSDVLIPMLNFMAADPIGDYLVALQLLESAAQGVAVVVPGHGSVGGADELHTRIEQDRAYVEALRDGRSSDDRRIGPDAHPGWEWVSDIHAGQVQHLVDRG